MISSLQLNVAMCLMCGSDSHSKHRSKPTTIILMMPTKMLIESILQVLDQKRVLLMTVIINILFKLNTCRLKLSLRTISSRYYKYIGLPIMLRVSSINLLYILEAYLCNWRFCFQLRNRPRIPRVVMLICVHRNSTQELKLTI